MPPPPFQLFRKFICFGGVTPTLPSYGNKFSINNTSRLTKPIAPLQELVWIYFERAQHFDKCLNTAWNTSLLYLLSAAAVCLWMFAKKISSLAPNQIYPLLWHFVFGTVSRRGFPRRSPPSSSFLRSGLGLSFWSCQSVSQTCSPCPPPPYTVWPPRWQNWQVQVSQRLRSSSVNQVREGEKILSDIAPSPPTLRGGLGLFSLTRPPCQKVQIDCCQRGEEAPEAFTFSIYFPSAFPIYPYDVLEITCFIFQFHENQDFD